MSAYSSTPTGSGLFRDRKQEPHDHQTTPRHRLGRRARGVSPRRVLAARDRPHVRLQHLDGLGACEEIRVAEGPATRCPHPSSKSLRRRSQA